MPIQYKEKCRQCKKNYVLTTRRTNYVVCFDCQKRELNQPIEDEKMKEFFDIPDDYYKTNGFLRSVKINYLKYGNLSERQLETFEKVVKQMEEGV